MSEHLENQEQQPYDLITLVDEEGEEHTFEWVDTIMHNETEYRALIAVFEDPEDFLQDDASLVIMKVAVEEGDDVYLDIIEDDDEYETVAEIFVERLSDDFDVLEEFDEELDNTDDEEV